MAAVGVIALSCDLQTCAMMNQELAMRALEFDGTITTEGLIAIPPEAAAEIPAGENVRVVVMWPESTILDADWCATGRRAFEASYSAEDDVYQQLADDSAGR